MALRTKGLKLIILVPVLFFVVFAGTGLYVVILRPIDAFVENSIRDNLLWMSGGLYRIADSEVDELNRRGLARDEKATKIGQLSVLIDFEDFARQNRIGVIVHATDGKRQLFLIGVDDELSKAAGDVHGRDGYLSLPGRSTYYFRTVDFVPWKWRITLLKDASAYSALATKVRYFYLATAGILVVLAGVLMLYLRQAIAGPIGQIVTRLKEGETPGYQGISEFEFLSDSIARMMRSLQEKTLHLRAILENMSDGIAVFDTDLRLVAWNRQYVRLNSFPDELIRFGRSYAEIIGYNIERGDYGPGDPEKQLEERLLRAQQVVPDGVEVRRPDGTWVEIKRNRMPAGGLVMTYNDITERKHAEEELAKHRDQLEQLVEVRTGELMQVNQRLKEAVRQMQAAKHRAEEANLAKSRFLSSMSHDLRTPLTAIIGFTRLVMRRAEDNLPPKQHANLEKIAISADDLLALIDDILDYTKTEAAHPSEIRLDSLVGECLRTVEPMVNKDRVRLVKEITPDLPQVFTDEKKLKRILINLLSNAVQFTEEGSVRVTVQPRDRQVDIAVQDTGTGIPEEALKRIFDEFEQGEQVRSRRHGGTGLGLAICRRFSQLIGGRIAVQSEVGVGSTFTLTIPVRYSMPSGNDTGADGGACRGMAKPDAMIVSPERDDASGDEESPDR